MIIESPLIQELRARWRQQDILRFLTGRFGNVPPEIVTALQAITEEARLNDLVDWAARCPDLEAFRARLLPGPAPA
jgi:hypothetical protein